MFGAIDKRLIAAAVLLAWLVFLAIQIVRSLGGGMPHAPELTYFAPIGAKINRARQLDEAFSSAMIPRFKPPKATSDPFYTPPPPAPPPAPPPSNTKQLELLYQGFVNSSQGEKKAFVMVGDKLVVGGVGTKVVLNYLIAGISPTVLSLKDDSGKELPLSFNAKMPIQVPAQ